jgi:hypothetical protein
LPSVRQQARPWSRRTPDGGSVAEDLNDCAGIDELSPAQRRELADQVPVPTHHEGSTVIQRTHDAATVVAQLALAELLTHSTR